MQRCKPSAVIAAAACFSSASALDSAPRWSLTASSSPWSWPICLAKKKWRRHVADIVERLKAALEPDYIVLGGGNLKKLKKLPPGAEPGDNRNAFRGGFRLWEAGSSSVPAHAPKSPASKRS